VNRLRWPVEELRSNLWFLSAVMAGAVALAVGLVEMDSSARRS
jgi:hypothetical protein